MIEYKFFRGKVIRVRTHRDLSDTTVLKRNRILHNRNFIGIGFNR